MRKPSVALPFGLTWSDFDWTPVVRAAPAKRPKVKPVKPAPVAPTRPGPKYSRAELKHIKAALHAVAVKVQAAGHQQADAMCLQLAEQLRTQARLDWRVSEALDNFRLACAMARGNKGKEAQRG